MARKRKKKKKGDSLGQWQEFFKEEGRTGGEAEGKTGGKARRKAKKKAGGKPATPVEKQPEPVSPETLPESPPPEEEAPSAPEPDAAVSEREEPVKDAPEEEEEIEGEMEMEGAPEAEDEEAGEPEEKYIEPPPGEEAYWKEQETPKERPGPPPSDVPISEWEKTLVEASKEEPEEEGEGEGLEEKDDGFAWPTVEDAKREEAERGAPVEARSDDEAIPEPESPGAPGESMDRGAESVRSPLMDETEETEEMEEMEEMENEQMTHPDAGELGTIQRAFESIITEFADLHKGRAGEMLEGLVKAGETLEAQHRRIMDLLRNNDVQAREARMTYASVEKRRDIKRERESQVAELTSVNDKLTGTGERLRDERANLSREKDTSTEENVRMKGESQSLREAIERLILDQAELDTETTELEKKRDRVEEDVLRLTRLKEEYLTNIARYREDV